MANEFGDVLRRLRVQVGVTQEELAERSGVSVSTIRGLETGKRSNPRMATTVLPLADAMPLRPEEREELLNAAVGRTPDPPPAHDPLTYVAEELAKVVAARWQREEEQRQIQDPFPLPVRWRAAPENLTDHWADIRRLPPGAAGAPLDLSGQLSEIGKTYRAIPSKRLVVLGRSGSGKTILALRFVLDHLKSRTPTEPVPVIFSIGAWHPTAITLRDWLTEQLMRDHPALAARGPGGASLAAALVESGRVLPVLDGFDEIAAGLRRPALEALNATTLPLLLTSRPAEYAAAVNETDVLTAAALIELTDLTLEDLAAYLPRTTRKADRTDLAANAWDPVLTALHNPPQDEPDPPLAAVLTTPLMVALARTIYSDTPDHDPASLLDTERFGSPEALEDHLLDNFIRSVYRDRPQQGSGGSPRPGCDPERARRWLGYLAHHLTQLDTPDLAWWRLGSALRPAARTLVTAAMTGLVIGLIDYAVTFTAGEPFVYPIVNGTAVGLLSALAFGIAYWLMFAVKDLPVMPSTVRLQFRGMLRNPRRRTGPQQLIGALGGLVFGVGCGFVVGMADALHLKAGLSAGLRLGLVDGVVYGLVFCGAAGTTFCLLGLMEAPLDIRSAVNPRRLLATNRRTVISQMLVWTPIGGALVGLGGGVAVRFLPGLVGHLSWPPMVALVISIIAGLSTALGYTITMTAWGQWVVLSRLWLPLTGRLPWAVQTFLQDAYQRGLLRQAGAVYQFRHSRLQHHLARTHRTRVPGDSMAPPGHATAHEILEAGVGE